MAMEGIFQWVKGLVYYLIMISLITNLVPNGKYDRYIRLFSGAVFILLVIRPLSGGLNLEGKLAYAYERIRFQQDTGELEKKIWGMEEERTKEILSRYEEAAAREVRNMAAAEGLRCQEVEAVIEGDPEKENFGQLTGLTVVLERDGWKEGSVSERGEENPGEGETGVQQVEPVEIQVGREERLKRQKEQEALYEFQRRLAAYYGLEENGIRITWEDDEGQLGDSSLRGADPDDSGSTGGQGGNGGR